MRSARQILVRTAFFTALTFAGACSYGQVTPAATSPATNLGLNDPHLPVASGSVPQPADTTLESAKVPDPTDRSAESSPLPAQRPGSSLPANAALSIQLKQALSSGTVRNGDTVRGVLTGPLQTAQGKQVAAGTPVEGTVVAAAKAGTVGSAGTLSLQLTKVGAIPIVTDVVDFNGQEGHKDVADAAPAKGTEAVVAASTTLQFHVLRSGEVPGLVKGANVQQVNGGPTVGSGGGATVTDKGPNTGPGVNQTPVNGTTTPKP